jgi:tripartite-type tricarboxylate transporter receptor subunit TctC
MAWLCRLRAIVATVAGVASLAAVAGAQAPADPVAEFYRGKTIHFVIGSNTGGGFDAYARLVARHLGKYIPGNPAVVAQNMPGAGSNKAAGYLYAQAPKDGTTIGSIQPGAVLHPLLTEQPAGHDPSKFHFLGSASKDYYLCFVRSDAPVKSFAETFTTEVILGAAADSALPRDLPAMLNHVLGTRLRVVAGYAGSRQTTLAVERGEVHGMCGIGWSSLSMQHPDWIARGAMRIIVQEDVAGHPEMNRMGVPRSIDFAKTAEDRQVMELVYSQSLFGRPYVIPPGVPAERLAALRAAFVQALQDRALLAEATSSRLDIDPMAGDELQALIARLFALPPKIAERARRALIYKPPS